METLDIEEVRDRLDEQALLFENPSYETYISGISDEHRACYLLSKMIEYLINDKTCVDSNEVMDFISYNTIRSLPYFNNDLKPIVVEDI